MAARRTYEDLEPPVEWSEEDGCRILTLYLPGFSKEQIRVQVSSARKLRISGERPYRDKTWQRFHKEFQIPPNCDTSNITAKYKGGILHVRQPLRDESRPHTAAPKARPPEQHVKQQAAPKAQPPEQQVKQQVEAPEKKSSIAANGKVEATSSKETTNDSRDDAGKALKDAPERANIRNKIMSQAVQLKEVIAGNWVLILPILLAVLIFLYAKRLSPTMFVGVGETPQ